MKILVTGCAGFIGGKICERLLADGHKVTGIDSITAYYPPRLKKLNLARLLGHRSFSFVKQDLLKADLPRLLKGTAVVFHQAGQPGVRASWGTDFKDYLRNNITATQLLLEAARQVSLRRFVYASSSSIYGDVQELPLKETARPQPYSPYGVTKLSAENLCLAYYRNFAVPVVALRYFTVYGPGQRPDMAFHKWLRAIRQGGRLELYGDGSQTRDFTFVGDAVEGNILAMRKGKPGTVYNIGGGSRVSVKQVFKMIEKITGSKLAVKRTGRQRGDVRHTLADTSRARRELGFRPKIKLAQGLELEWEYICSLYKGTARGKKTSGGK